MKTNLTPKEADHQYAEHPIPYAERVRTLESEGMSTSDAQAVIGAEDGELFGHPLGTIGRIQNAPEAAWNPF